MFRSFDRQGYTHGGCRKNSETGLGCRVCSSSGRHWPYQHLPQFTFDPAACWLVPYDIRHEALQDIMKQFACMGKQSRARGYQNGDLFDHNLSKHQVTDAAQVVGI